jgi:hypothetical protein
VKEKAFVLLQLVVIVAMSAAAGYAFQHTKTVYEFNGLCIYRYFAYSAAVLLSYLSFFHYKKVVGLAFSLTLAILALSPIGPIVIEQFPLFAPLLAVLMGATSFLAFPNFRRRGFFEFLLVLILPSILAESKIVGSSGLIATTESPGYLLISAITVCIIGGCFYLRYATFTNLNRLALLSSGGSEFDVAKVSQANNNIVGLIVLGACGTAFSLMAATPIFADALRGAFTSQPVYVVASAFGLALALLTLLYVFQLYGKEPQERQRKPNFPKEAGSWK